MAVRLLVDHRDQKVVRQRMDLEYLIGQSVRRAKVAVVAV